MKNPKIIETVTLGATYKIPAYSVTNEGIQDGVEKEIFICKGDKNDIEKFRQEGVFVESLLQVCKQYLETVNFGTLASRETSMAVTKIDEALMWLNKRAEDRKLREVQGTYQK